MALIWLIQPYMIWDRFGSVRFRFPGTGEFPVPGSVRFGFRFLTGLVSGS